MYWLDLHHREWEDMEEDWEVDEEMTRFGTIPGQEPDFDQEIQGRDHLLMCCGIPRPLDKAATLTVEAEGEFLTVDDFVSAVHPWLLSLREDILSASGDLLSGKPLPPDTKLMVSYPEPGSLMVMEEEAWKRFRKKHPLHALLATMSC